MHMSCFYCFVYLILLGSLNVSWVLWYCASSPLYALIVATLKSFELTRQLTNKPICERSCEVCDERIKAGMHQRRERAEGGVCSEWEWMTGGF